MADSNNNAWHQPSILPLQNEVARTTFAGVLAAINILAAGRFASKIRQSSQYSTSQEGIHFNNISDALIPCRVLEKPMHGTFNIVFELEFQDGVSWMLKVPANGHGNEFCTLSQNALISEARTMQMIGSETTVPVPRVYAFESSVKNELGVPFNLMQKIDGINLGMLWFDSTDNFRAHVLQDLAAAMVQLQKFKYDRSGSLLFDADGKLAGIGPMKIEDGIHYMDGSHKHKPAEGPRWSAKGPLADAKSCYLFTLDRLANGVPEFNSCNPELDSYSRGLYKSLRLFIDWACQIHAREGQHFVLSHTDLDLQNIIVGEDGTVRGIIDWDGAASVPREVSCLSPPKWLMADWLKDFLESWGYPSVNVKECESYRARYAQMVEAEIRRTTDSSLGSMTLDSLSGRGADVTRRSVLMKNLDIAANYANMSPYVVEYIHYQIKSLTSENWCEAAPESFLSCWKHDSPIQSPETEDPEKDNEATHDRDDISRHRAEKVDRVLFDALAKVGESLKHLSQLPQSPGRSSERDGPEIPIEDSKNDLLTESKNPFTSGTQTSSVKAKAIQLCCGMGEIGLRRLAKVLYKKVESAQENQSTAKTQSSTAVEKEITLGWVWEKLMQLMGSLRKMIDLAQSWSKYYPAKSEDSSIEKDETEASQKAHMAINKDPLGVRLKGDDVNVIKDNIQEIPHDSLEKVTRVSTEADIGASLAKEIADISARRKVLLNRREEKRREIKRTAQVAAEDAKQVVWNQIANEVETSRLPLDFLQMNQHQIVVGIINAFREDEREQMELFTPQSMSQAAKIPVPLHEIEDGMFQKAQASKRRYAFVFRATQTCKTGTTTLDDDVPRTMAKAFDLDVANQKLRSILGVQRAEPEVTIPREIQQTTFTMGNEKLKALLGLATSGPKGQQYRNSDPEAANLEQVEAELMKRDGRDSRTPSPDGDQEDYVEASTGFTTLEKVFFQEPKPCKREMASSIEGKPGATDFDDFVRGLLDASKLEVEKSTTIADWEENGVKELVVEEYKDTSASNRDPAIPPLMTASPARVSPAFTNDGKPIPRNKPCPCGSRHKYKKCCGAHQKSGDEAKENQNLPLNSEQHVFHDSVYGYEDFPGCGDIERGDVGRATPAFAEYNTGQILPSLLNDLPRPISRLDLFAFDHDEFWAKPRRDSKKVSPPLQPGVNDSLSHLPRFTFEAPNTYGCVGDRDAVTPNAEGGWNAWQNGGHHNVSEVCEKPGEVVQEDFNRGKSVGASNGFQGSKSESDADFASVKSKECSGAKSQVPMHVQIQGGLEPYMEAKCETPISDHGYRYVAGEYPAQFHYSYEEEEYHNDYHSEESWDDSYGAEWVDDGTYTMQNVCMLLDQGELDELRLLRLKQGFFMLMQKLENA